MRFGATPHRKGTRGAAPPPLNEINSPAPAGISHSKVIFHKSTIVNSFRWKKHFLRSAFFWCGWRDLNPYEIAFTRTWWLRHLGGRFASKNLERIDTMLGCKNHEVFAKFTGSAACCKIYTILTQKIHESFAGMLIFTFQYEKSSFHLNVFPCAKTNYPQFPHLRERRPSIVPHMSLSI